MMKNPWLNLPEKPPYVLEGDNPNIWLFNNKKPKPEHFIHLCALPEPYLGNPNAPVVILNLNPGHSPIDAEIHAQPHFAKASRDNLLHFRESYPLYLLDPELPSPGQTWWSSRLRELIDTVGLEKVAHNVFVAEYFPYHSSSYAHHRLHVPSQNYTFFLVRKAIQRNALIIFFRSVRPWRLAVPELNGYSRLAVVGNVQKPYLSRGNLPNHFSEIVAEVGKTHIGANRPVFVNDS